MTLVLAYSSSATAVMVGDRLVTLQRTGLFAGQHDTIANKTIVLITHDAIVAAGYCGSSYVGTMPTDNWIVDTVSLGADLIAADGSTGIFGFKYPNKLRLHQICNRLRRGLAGRPGGPGVTIMMVGWRLRKPKLLPIIIRFGASRILGPSPNLRMRPEWPLSCKTASIGANMNSSHLEVCGSLPRYFPWWDTDSIVRTFTYIIRETACNNSTVGPNVMSIVLKPFQRKIICNFDPIDTHLSNRSVQGQQIELPVAYSPWILSPNHYLAPTEATGESGSAATWDVGDWIFEISDTSREASVPSNVGWTMAQRRRPRP